MVGRIHLFILLSLAPWLAVSSAAAEATTPFDWRGFYVGIHSGGALGLVDVADPYGSSIFGDTVRTPGFLVGGQFGYNWQRGPAVFGFEADMSWADMDGTNTCFAYSGFFVSSNCAAHINAMGTFTGRLGWTLPFDPNTLVYGKAGVATAHTKIAATPGGDGGFARTAASSWRWGWTVGAGVERTITSRWTAKAEYGFLAFDGSGFTAPSSDLQVGTSLTPLPATGTNVSQNIHQFKIGMNYRLGAGSPGEVLHQLPETSGSANDFQFKAGVRYVHGWTQFHKDLGIAGRGVAGTASRLTYDSPGLNGMEAFARIDTPFGLMVKGVLGGVSGSGGRLNDEDWGIPFAVFVPYSNTISTVDNKVAYWTVDIGYDWRRDASNTVAPFVGYSRLRQKLKGFGCTQIANPSSDCNPALPTSVLGIAEDDTWQALRVGMAVDIRLAPRLTLTADVAYLPYVRFSGIDDHVLRSLLSPEKGSGLGVQLEAMLSYALTDAFSIGIGGRYWSMWTTSGDVNFGGTGEAIIPMRYAVEQAQILVQGSYKFSVAPSP